MSATAWVTLAASTAFTCGVIYYVHLSQKREKERLREGVIFDLDRQHRKTLNIQQLERQADLTKILRRQQKDHDTKQEIVSDNNRLS